MTVQKFWENIKKRVVSNWYRVERFLASSTDGMLATWETAWRSLQTYIAVPKHFLLITLGGVLVYDILTKGANGSIAFLMKTLNETFHATASGSAGWPIVALVALFVMYQDKKK